MTINDIHALIATVGVLEDAGNLMDIQRIPK